MDIENHSNKKHVVVLGMNHTSSKVELRDQILFSGNTLTKGLEKIIALSTIDEAVILSTCNRVEIYAVVKDVLSAQDILLHFLANFHHLPHSNLAPHMYYYHCAQAIEHLYRVVASLDSMIIGENQIMAQVKNAYAHAHQLGATGTILNKLFHFAIEAGKRVRHETKISSGAVSISSAAIELAKKILGQLTNKSALILGAGEMSKLTARHLLEANIRKIYFANRTYTRAQEMAAQFGGETCVFDTREKIMTECDIVISATGSSDYIIHVPEIRQVMKKRKSRAIFLIDIAAPRDIHPEVEKIDNVFLYSIDDLQVVVEENARNRYREISAAQKILKEEYENYYHWYRSLKILPTLISLRKHFETMCQEELERYNSAINALPTSSQKLVKQFAQSLTKKLLRQPTKILHENETSDQGTILASSIASLYELETRNKKKERHREIH